MTINVATRRFETPHKVVTLLDAPGHRDFVPNMIGGAAQVIVRGTRWRARTRHAHPYVRWLWCAPDPQADAAILVINATTGEFEAGPFQLHAYEMLLPLL